MSQPPLMTKDEFERKFAYLFDEAEQREMYVPLPPVCALEGCEEPAVWMVVPRDFHNYTYACDQHAVLLAGDEPVDFSPIDLRGLH